MHIEFLLEEPSAEALLKGLLPRLLPQETTYDFHVFQGKADLRNQLLKRLRAYRHWIPPDWRIVVLMDEDREDCSALKAEMEKAAADAGFTTKTPTAIGEAFAVLNRIAVEEIEAWFFGDLTALAEVYPGVPATLRNQAKYRDPDAIAGGTWEALERVLQRAGYFSAGMPKIEVARNLGEKMTPEANSSGSFQTFVHGLAAL